MDERQLGRDLDHAEQYPSSDATLRARVCLWNSNVRRGNVARGSCNVDFQRPTKALFISQTKFQVLPIEIVNVR